MNAKLFSIITPTYNCKKEIEKTINSVLSQKKSLFEYIIIDANSNDGTLDILNEYRGKIKLIIDDDKGIYDAMNKGISIAKGKYLYFIGAGDCLRKNILENLEEIIPKAGIYFIYGDVERINPYNRLQHNYGYNKWNICTNIICHQAIFYSKEIFELLGKYDLNYRISADQIKNIECFGNKDIKKKYINTIIADYNGGGISDFEDDKIYPKGKGKIILKNLGFIYFIFFIFRERLVSLLSFLKLKSKISTILEKYKIRL